MEVTLTSFLSHHPTSLHHLAPPHLRRRRPISPTSPHHHHYKKFPLFHPLHKTHKKCIIPLSSSSTAPPPEPPPPSPPELPPPPQGAKPIPLIISLALGFILFFFFIPRPSELTPQAWQLLSRIAGLVLSPLPVDAWAFLCLTTSVLTGTLPFTAAFSAFTNEVIWLIVISFFFSRGFVKTGLGDRIAMYFVKWLVKSTLGLSYGLTLSEALIAPAMPSTTARAGGVFLPIIQSLSLSAGSQPTTPPRRSWVHF